MSASTEASRPAIPVPVRALLATGPLVAVAGLLVELLATRGLSPRWVRLFSLSEEQNLPTAYAALLLLACALGLATTARRLASAADRRWTGYLALAGLMAYVAIDECLELHERLASLHAGHGLLYFGWVVPGAMIVLALAIVIVPFVLRLPRSTRGRFVLAAAIYVGGALGMELPLGLYTERYGDVDFGYAFIDWIEECLELLGAGVFVVAIARDELRRQRPALR